MATEEVEFRRLLADPRETLDVELKGWIDPSSPEGIAKIARGCMALRNNNGGCLIVGFMDTGLPDKTSPPADVRGPFHVDKIQAIVGKYSAEQFAIEVHFIERDGKEYPVISVPSGVRTPVAAKAELRDGAGKVLVKDHAVYTRSLSSNNTVSSTEARRGDWERITRICFDNREADIGSFVRRHLVGLDLGQLATLLNLTSTVPTTPTPSERAKGILDFGRDRFNTILEERGVKIPKLGYREAAIVLDGEVPTHAATDSFLQRLFVAKPRHTGWTPWADTRSAREAEIRPYVYEGGWESFLAIGGASGFMRPSLDFWRIDPQGSFYHLRALEDDLAGERGPKPGTQLDFMLQIMRVAEIISVALSFARSMGCDESKTSVVLAFRWSGLKERLLTSWVDIERTIYIPDPARQDQLVTTVVVPLVTPQSNIATYAERVVKDLFALFGGKEFSSQVIGGIVLKALENRF